MDGWILFSKIVFGVGLGFFTILAVIVTIGGAKDIRSMLATLDQQHKDHVEE